MEISALYLTNHKFLSNVLTEPMILDRNVIYVGVILGLVATTMAPGLSS